MSIYITKKYQISQVYDTAFIFQVNHIFVKKKISLNKESENFAIISFQKLPQSLHAFVLHFICTILFY